MMALELAVACLLVLLTLLFTFTTFHVHSANVSEAYSRKILRKKLLLASEILITSSDKGLAQYSENKVKHHQISEEKLRYLESMPAEQLGERLGLRKAWLNNKKGTACIRRIGVMNGKPLVITLCTE